MNSNPFNFSNVVSFAFTNSLTKSSHLFVSQSIGSKTSPPDTVCGLAGDRQ
jgi:hypothetical protein